MQNCGMIAMTSPPGLCGNACTLRGILLCGEIFVLTKEFKTIDEQLDILCSRGLTIEDREKAADFLIHNNYYRVSGYSLTLRDHDVFVPQATFQNIIDIYNFDYHLRHILLHYIELIETSFKSIYAYEFAQAFGPLGYKSSSSFTDYKVYMEVLSKVNEVVNKNKNILLPNRL